MGAHAACAALILHFVFPRAGAERRRSLVRWWSARLVRLLGVEVRVAGAPPSPGSAAMIAANHISWLDIFVVMGVQPARFIAKSEIRDWPVAGWIAERAGTLFIRRARRHDTARINEQVHAAFAEGACVGLFPEGTTTEGDHLLRFHSSLFEPAIANAAVRASRGHPLCPHRRQPVPRDGLRGRDLVHAIAGARDPPARRGGAPRVRAAGADGRQRPARRGAHLPRARG